MKWLSNLTLLFLLLTVLQNCGEKDQVEDSQLRPVRYTEVGYMGSNEMRTLSGTARTDKIINLSFRSNGIITQFNLKLGQEVSKGELLGKLDNVQARLAYEQAVTQLNSAASQLNTAKLSMNRIRSLYEKGSASLSDFETAKNSYNTAQESYKSAQRGVSIQQDQISYGILYAPSDGIIASVAAEIDENVSAGQLVATMNAGNDMEINLGVPESMINGVKSDMKVAVQFSAIEGKTFEGSVTEISPSVDASTATYPVRVAINNPAEEIRSGMAANVTFDFGDASSVEKQLIVPAVSVGEDIQGNFVFVIEDDGQQAQIRKQTIEIGELTSEGFVVKSGISPGEKVATAGLQTLLDGQKVSLQK